MRLSFATFLSVLVTSTVAVPTKRVNLLQDVLLFDSPAFPDPANPGQTLVALQSFVSLRQIDLGFLSSGVEAALNGLGIDVGDKISLVLDRLKLFGAIGLAGEKVEVNVDGCSKKAVLSGTSGLPDLGVALQTVSLGTCQSGAKPLTGTVKLSALDSRKFSGKIFPSVGDGFGVISDIDDTIKISNVNDKLELIKATLLEQPKAVPGMPELYASLAANLNSPQFIYITGSPFQLYPLLRNFLDTAYTASNGPIFMQNLTLVDIPGLLDFAKSDGVLEYKTSMVDRVQAMYPKKRFVAIGDSTQKDPETYGSAFRKHGSFISCILIRRVEGSDNTAERFNAAFKDVPAANFRIFDDNQIASFQKLNLAGGTC